MASSIPSCPHEPRPGISVCLRCQHAERAVKRAKQRQAFARGGAAVLSMVVIAATGIAGATAWRARAGSNSAPSLLITADSIATTVPTGDDSTEAAGPTPQLTAVSATVAAVPSSPALPPVSAAARQVTLVVPVGRTALRDTMVADRAGDTVRVSFDLLLSRTRRPDKFEAIMRSTLPQVYGAIADSALRALPTGAVARAGDLIETLPERGFHIPLAGGRTIAVWPVTREGRDGPLVVAYRAVASR